MVLSTQQVINIAGIKDGIVVMKDGSYCLVLQVAATNFALKSEQEQNSIVFQYQGFLNSLHFPIEIVINSRRLDLTPYLKKIEGLAEGQKNELLKMQTNDYIDFLKKLIDLANIMKKTFYVTIPYRPLSIKKTGFFDSLFNKKTSLFEHVKISEDDFKTHTEKLREMGNTVAMGLGTMGLHCFQLTTEQLIELFYLLYNPDEAAKEIVKDATQLASPVIMNEDEFKNKGGAPLQNNDGKEEKMIDNSQVVEERHKRETEAKKYAQDAENRNNQTAAPSTPAPAPQATQQPAAVTTPAANPVPAAASPATPPTQPSQPPIQNQSS